MSTVLFKPSKEFPPPNTNDFLLVFNLPAYQNNQIFALNRLALFNVNIQDQSRHKIYTSPQNFLKKWNQWVEDLIIFLGTRPELLTTNFNFLKKSIMEQPQTTPEKISGMLFVLTTTGEDLRSMLEPKGCVSSVEKVGEEIRLVYGWGTGINSFGAIKDCKNSEIQTQGPKQMVGMKMFYCIKPQIFFLPKNNFMEDLKVVKIGLIMTSFTLRTLLGLISKDFFLKLNKKVKDYVPSSGKNCYFNLLGTCVNNVVVETRPSPWKSFNLEFLKPPEPKRRLTPLLEESSYSSSFTP